MPTYHYICDCCHDEFEIHQSFNDKSLKRCSKCKKHKLRRILYEPYVSIRLSDSDIKTLDHLGRRNVERDTKNGIIQERNEREIEAKTKEEKYIGKYKVKKRKKVERPFWRDTDKIDTSLANLSDEKKNDYVMKGIK